MLEGKRLYIFYAVYFVLLLMPAYWFALFETTDARYAEISREMLASGNFLEPYYNGIKHFHKPPFTYWITSLGLAIFGVNGFGARFFAMVAGIIILAYTRKNTLLLTEDEEIADVSVLVMASSILFLIVNRVVSTDIYLTMFVIMALYYMFRQIYLRKELFNTIAFGLLLGLGFMTKGPIIFLFTLLPFAVACFVDKKHRRAFGFIDWLIILVLFSVVALPWYAYVVSVNDGLLNYFLKDQTVERVATDKFNRSKPFHFFFVVFGATFFPWIFYLFANFKNTRLLKSGKVIYLYIIMPFIVFQIATSKLATYILPFYPVAAAIVAVKVRNSKFNNLSFLLFTALGIGLAVSGFVVDFLQPYIPYILAFSIIYVIAGIIIFKGGILRENYVPAVSFMIIFVTIFIYSLLPFIGPYSKGYRLIAEDIKKYDPEGKYEVLIYDIFTPSISFYLEDVKMIALSKERETQFQQRDEYKDIYAETHEELKEYLANHDELILFTKTRHYKEFVKVYGYECEIFSKRGKNKELYFCTKPDKE
jgi:4-amino-4-deoxy-L-arabinose transferase